MVFKDFYLHIATYYVHRLMPRGDPVSRWKLRKLKRCPPQFEPVTSRSGSNSDISCLLKEVLSRIRPISRES